MLSPFSVTALSTVSKLPSLHLHCSSLALRPTPPLPGPQAAPGSLCSVSGEPVQEGCLLDSFWKVLGSSRPQHLPHLPRPWLLPFPTACSDSKPRHPSQGSSGRRLMMLGCFATMCSSSQQWSYFPDVWVWRAALDPKSCLASQLIRSFSVPSSEHVFRTHVPARSVPVQPRRGC